MGATSYGPRNVSPPWRHRNVRKASRDQDAPLWLHGRLDRTSGAVLRTSGQAEGTHRSLRITAQHEALEEAVAERVVAGEPVHALLLEQQEPVEPGVGDRGAGGLQAAGVLGRGEVRG